MYINDNNKIFGRCGSGYIPNPSDNNQVVMLHLCVLHVHELYVYVYVGTRQPPVCMCALCYTMCAMWSTMC